MAHIYATMAKIAVNRLAKLKMATTLRGGTRSRIGMFHAIVRDDAPLTDEYACRISDFERIIEAQLAKGFRFVSLAELLAMPWRDARTGFCALTFDDGFSGVASLAEPCLTKRSIPFTIYVTTGLLDAEGYLSSEALRRLSQNPLCTVGSHLVTHPMTRFLPAQAVLFEMTESKRRLTQIVKRPVTHLAFPYGSAYACSLRDVRLARRAGYESAALTTATVLDGCRPYRNYTLPRLNMFIV